MGVGCECSEEPLKIFRGAFELMKFFAEQKCPGLQGERGPTGCQGAAGGGTEREVTALIKTQVCDKFTESVVGVQQVFWQELVRGTDSNALARYCTPEPKWIERKWCNATAEATGAQLDEQLRLHMEKGYQVGEVEPVVRQTWAVGTTDIVVARTIVRVGCDGTMYLVTSVETSTDLLFVFKTETLTEARLIHTGSVEQYLLYPFHSEDRPHLRILSSLCRNWASEKVRSALLQDAKPALWGAPAPDDSAKIKELFQKKFVAQGVPNDLRIVVVGIRGDYAFVVPVLPRNFDVGSDVDVAYDGPYIKGITSHMGGAVLEIRRGTLGVVEAITSVESPTGVPMSMYSLVQAVCLALIYSMKTGMNWTDTTGSTSKCLESKWFLDWAKRESASRVNPNYEAIAVAASAVLIDRPSVTLSQNQTVAFLDATRGEIENRTGITESDLTTKPSVRMWTVSTDRIREKVKAPSVSWNTGYESKSIRVALHTAEVTHAGVTMCLTITWVEVPRYVHGGGSILSQVDAARALSGNVWVIDTITITPPVGVTMESLMESLKGRLTAGATDARKKLLALIELDNARLPPLAVPPIPNSKDVESMLAYFDGVVGASVDRVDAAIALLRADTNTGPSLGDILMTDELGEQADMWNLSKKLCYIAVQDVKRFSFEWVVQELRVLERVIGVAINELQVSFPDEFKSLSVTLGQLKLDDQFALHRLVDGLEGAYVYLSKTHAWDRQRARAKLGNLIQNQYTSNIEQRAIMYAGIPKLVGPLCGRLLITLKKEPSVETPQLQAVLSVVPFLQQWGRNGSQWVDGAVSPPLYSELYKLYKAEGEIVANVMGTLKRVLDNKRLVPRK
jgi:hypothetical protein